MKFKIKVIFLIFLICLIVGVSIFSVNLFNNFEDFHDVGTSSDYNSNWINQNLSINRTNDYTVLSNLGDFSQSYTAKVIFSTDCVIEWDNYGKPNNLDYCIISDQKNIQSNVINFDNLGIDNDSHIKIVISDGIVKPYVDNVAKPTFKLNANINHGLIFHFQINPGGADIKYSNFSIHK